jgi:hypothetical protein
MPLGHRHDGQIAFRLRLSKILWAACDSTWNKFTEFLRGVSLLNRVLPDSPRRQSLIWIGYFPGVRQPKNEESG